MNEKITADTNTAADKCQKAGRALIVTGGSLDYEWAAEYVKTIDFQVVIAADKGLMHCIRLGIKPDYCLGDFDSFCGGADGARNAFGQEVRQYPCEKDDTDTQLAIRAAMELGCKSAVLIGATGTRLDHVLANIGNLFLAKEKGLEIELVDKNNRIYPLIGGNTNKEGTWEEKSLSQDASAAGSVSFTKENCYGKYISVIAYGGNLSGVSYEGFRYELHNAAIELGSSIGVSNELSGEKGKITVGRGKAVILETKD